MRDPHPRVYVLCSSSATGLGWPDSAHRTLEDAQAAAEAAAGHPLVWIGDSDRSGAWYTKDLLHDWMIPEVALQAERRTSGAEPGTRIPVQGSES